MAKPVAAAEAPTAKRVTRRAPVADGLDLDTRGLSVSDGLAAPVPEGGSVSISQRDEINEVASRLMDEAPTDEERELVKEATDRILSRYYATN